MRMTSRWYHALAVAALLVTITAAGSSPASARISTADAAARAQERFDGSVLDVELDDADDDEPATEVYEVKLLTSTGVIIRVRIDATTGAYLEAKGDNLIPAMQRSRAPR